MPSDPLLVCPAVDHYSSFNNRFSEWSRSLVEAVFAFIVISSQIPSPSPSHSFLQNNPYTREEIYSGPDYAADNILCGFNPCLNKL